MNIYYIDDKVNYLIILESEAFLWKQITVMGDSYLKRGVKL